MTGTMPMATCAVCGYEGWMYVALKPDGSGGFVCVGEHLGESMGKWKKAKDAKHKMKTRETP